MSTKRLAAVWLLATCLGGLAFTAAGEDTLAGAKDLYGTAAYQDALRMLDRLKANAPSADDALEIEKYRAFCLFGLGRTADAEQVVIAMLAVRPGFRVDEAEASPRVVAAFRDVRRRQLPLMIQKAYGLGRDAYDQKRTDDAIEQFRRVLQLADDRDAPKDSSLIRDMQVLASGFLSLAEAGKAGEAKAAEAKAAADARAAAMAKAAAAPAVTRRFYTAEDADVTPPRIISQDMPTWPLGVQWVTAKGVLEVLINERGEVETAALRARIHPAFDSMVLDSAKTWRYSPATRASQPVKYMKRIEIDVRPPG